MIEIFISFRLRETIISVIINNLYYYKCYKYALTMHIYILPIMIYLLKLHGHPKYTHFAKPIYP
jgi:hypothetical protein